MRHRNSKREGLLAELAQRVVVVSPDRTIRVAIDGVDGAGKTTFADELGAFISALGRPVIRTSVDGFHNPKAVRYERGRHSPEGYFEDSYNYAALKRYLLDPLSPCGSQRYRPAVFDHVTDSAVAIVDRKALPSSILLIDGIFLASAGVAGVLGRVDLPADGLCSLGCAVRRAGRLVARSGGLIEPTVCRGPTPLSASLPTSGEGNNCDRQ
jgi:pantothenate kinase